jgi:hypothetical protein
MVGDVTRGGKSRISVNWTGRAVLRIWCVPR